MDYSDKRSGVYKITNTTNGKIYIGSSQSVGERWYKHFEYPHQSNCRKLRNAILKHGKQSFIVEVLEVVPLSLLTEREQHYLDKLQPFGESGYNIRVVAESNRGIKHTTQIKERWSEMKRGANNPMWGRKQTQRHKEAMSLRRGKRTSIPWNGPAKRAILQRKRRPSNQGLSISI